MPQSFFPQYLTPVVQTGERVVIFAERQRICVKAFEIGAEHIEKLIGRRAAALLFAFENHNLSGAHRVSDLLAE
ncbi:MAG: hypothetical protein ABL869_11510 [Candidatus Nitrotoga sp.]